jgi:hypothetical protein
MSFFPAPYSVSEGFSNLVSNTGKYSRFLIDALLLLGRVDTPRIVDYGELRLLIVYSGELQMYEFSAETLACLLMQGVDSPHIV